MWFSDECWFRLEAGRITQNCRILSKTQPNATVDKPRKRKPVKYWASINGLGEIVFKEVDDTMTADNYLGMIKKLNPVMKFRKRMIQQDGASIHRALKVRQFVDKVCEKGWIGIGSSRMKWPGYSPDLTPCDYGLWAYILPRVIRRGATTRAQLKEFIEEEFESIPSEVISNICLSVFDRCLTCIQNEGGNVEYYRRD